MSTIQRLRTPGGQTFIAFGKGAVLTVTGTPDTVKSGSKPQKTDETTTVGNYKIANWGPSNDLPQQMYTKIGKSTVLKTGLKYKRDVTVGQGIFPVFVEGYNDDGSEILKVVKEVDVVNFLQNRIIQRYLSNSTRDILKYGLCFPELLPSVDGSRIVGINCINALHGRWELADERTGIIKNLIVSGEWPNAKSDNISAVQVLDNYDPLFSLNALKAKGKLTKSLIYPVRDEFDGAEYYPLPDWWTAEESGWLEISRLIPDFLRNMYKNQASFKYHIRVPYSYWERRFPRKNHSTLSDQEYNDLIDEAIDSMIENVTDTRNANKAVLTHYDTGLDGKPEGIEIHEFSQKWSNENLMTSAIANSEILASLGINPAVRGLMPGSSIYAGNQGGSNIRESFLIDIALSTTLRNLVLNPIEDMMRFNGFDPAIQLRFRNTFLTTLDTGGGTAKKLG